MKKSKYQQYFHCIIFRILVPFAFQFIYQQNIVTILISAASLNAALIRGRSLFQCGYPKVRRLIETRRFLEEIRYVYCNYQFKMYFLLDNVINFEINFSFHIKPFPQIIRKVRGRDGGGWGGVGWGGFNYLKKKKSS